MKKILVIQQKMIGDVLVSTILCETLVKAFSNATIHYLIYHNTYPVLENNHERYQPILFTPEHRKSKKALFELGLQLRKENYDVVIDAYSKIESWVIVALSKAPIKISYKKKFSNVLYTHLVERHNEANTNLGLVIEHRLKLLQPLNIAENNYVTKPKINVAQYELNAVKTSLIYEGITLNKPIAMLNILGSSNDKTYPIKYMSTIVDEVAKNDVQIIFNYMPHQQAIVEELLSLCNKETKTKVFKTIIAKSIRELVAMICFCDFIIGNDGGAMNMAKALNIPTFIIFSPWIEKKAWNTFEDGQNNISVHLNDYLPEEFANKKLKTIKKENQKLYQKFKPDFFIPLIQNFLNFHLEHGTK